MQTRARRWTGGWLLALVAACGGATTEPTRGGPPAVEPAQERFAGEVLEVLRGGPYSYLRISAASGERWVVTMSSPPPPRSRVEVESYGLRRDFHARRIDRRFAVLDFGVVTLASSTL